MSGTISGPTESESPYYIISPKSLAQDRNLVLKHGDVFGVFESSGDISGQGGGSLGLYATDMRYLSVLRTLIHGYTPLVLGSGVTNDNARLVVDMTNPDLLRGEQIVLPRGSLHLARVRHLWDGAMWERLVILNCARDEVPVDLLLQFAFDFADIFEVRGSPRRRLPAPVGIGIGTDGIVAEHNGLDGVARRARIMFETTPTSIEQCQARYAMVLKPGAEVTIGWSLRCEPLWKHRIASFEVTEAEARTASAQAWAECCRVESDNEHLEDWLESALRDVLMLTTRTPLGDYPCAGVPWYSVPFGRDGIISALQMLWVAPGLARGVLAYLAAHQSSERDPARDAEPGKILHERRQDEMANTGEVPFGRYYGSVDATPLFVILAGAYYVETGDAAALRDLWPHVRRALDWIDRHGDLDGDGFVEYPGRSSHGLVNQGWKDSHDSVFHADGSSPEGPIALCEVQAYVIAAKQHAAAMAVALGIPEEAAHLARESEELRTRFEQAFWVEDIGCYALALDGAKRPCAVRTSNAGHVLFCGVASPERAARTMATLTAPAMHSGWGIRTVAMGEARYNPMSYHNGSVWPHDNAMIAAGFAHYGLRDACGSLLRTWLEASVFMDRARLPELCCGFERRSGQGPTLYPVACSPQAWSAGAPYMMLASCLGLRVAGARAQVRVVRPYLPESIDQVTIRGLRVGAGKVDLRIRREGSGVSVLTLAKDSDVEVVSLQ